MGEVNLVPPMLILGVCLFIIAIAVFKRFNDHLKKSKQPPKLTLIHGDKKDKGTHG